MLQIGEVNSPTLGERPVLSRPVPSRLVPSRPNDVRAHRHSLSCWIRSIPPHPNIVKVVSAWDTGTATDAAMALELASGDLHGALVDSRHSIGDLLE